MNSTIAGDVCISSSESIPASLEPTINAADDYTRLPKLEIQPEIEPDALPPKSPPEPEPDTIPPQPTPAPNPDIVPPRPMPGPQPDIAPPSPTPLQSTGN
jgi:hypothetical protein